MGVIRKMHSAEGSSVDGLNHPELDSLFREFYNRLVYFAFQLIHDQAQAQDIVQDVFIKYWQERDSVLPDRVAIKNYLYTSVRNASLNSIRHNRVVDKYIQQQGSDEPEELPVIESIISSEVIAEIHSAIESLPEHYRIISEMSYLEGKKNQEIADELGMSVNTVKKQKYRALELLRLRLAPELLGILILLDSIDIL